MDEEYEHRQSEAPLLKAMPSEYLKAGNWFYAAEPEEEGLPYGIERVGENNIVFASDYPHWGRHVPQRDQDHQGTEGHFRATSRASSWERTPRRSTAGTSRVAGNGIFE